MGMNHQIQQYATRRATRKLTRTVPWLGAIIALLTIGEAMRRKGFLGGALDTALDFTPVVGTIKNMAEVGRGRDFIRDSPPVPGRYSGGMTATTGGKRPTLPATISICASVVYLCAPSTRWTHPR